MLCDTGRTVVSCPVPSGTSGQPVLEVRCITSQPLRCRVFPCHCVTHRPLGPCRLSPSSPLGSMHSCHCHCHHLFLLVPFPPSFRSPTTAPRTVPFLFREVQWTSIDLVSFSEISGANTQNSTKNVPGRRSWSQPASRVQAALGGRQPDRFPACPRFFVVPALTDSSLPGAPRWPPAPAQLPPEAAARSAPGRRSATEPLGTPASPDSTFPRPVSGSPDVSGEDRCLLSRQLGRKLRGNFLAAS